MRAQCKGMALIRLNLFVVYLSECGGAQREIKQLKRLMQFRCCRGAEQGGPPALKSPEP
jgi:hypothetical protein